ncbi:DUF3077 domain-containing protein [Pseudomonas frederiksbergensis]|uniref:DUF3077 domain-containing protein n=1 Tax=Pseudomonas frederiksbergensis TaxID=104087 RepID=UPI000F4A431F|nr:DUF3077 domain-containing protein [Pseudomonas frederiksbergensis]RON42942.1 hypothetical protein BK667_30535 [Pseudomonas frederiksbergensis]
MTDQPELKTIGLTPAIYCADRALFHVTRDVPLGDALSMASDFLFLAKALTKDAAFDRDTGTHAWAAHYLTSMSKAVVDDAVKVLMRGRVSAGSPKRAAGTAEE